ncbi:hypothetical protein CWI75_04165 [Kineobactrum sediminis]|uniref:NRDE family protein n=1 Tax=Kineobactrum sediminis TaxID=1905677 RepID=A0A2N5Y575_9GAMM|nr:NRDE family protein [Kineobactrum sediminis]PLW83554.1 hypothetical protein CWI75_04165 [Kineobactrum sediminis]
MCLILFSWGLNPDYPLVVAANRDEFHARATVPARFWPDQPQLLAGRDLEQGGTWMGMNRSGRFAAITNYRDPSRSATGLRSRGELPLRFLLDRQTPEAWLRSVAAQRTEYAGFNLLVGAGEQLWYFSNSSADNNPRHLAAGIYGLSNASLDTPWPKVVLGKQRLQHLLETSPPTHDGLREVVADRRPAAPEDLHPLGLHETMDRQLSAQFIDAGAYGTRSTTTLWLQKHPDDPTALAHWRELNFAPGGREVNRHCEVFTYGGLP